MDTPAEFPPPSVSGTTRAPLDNSGSEATVDLFWTVHHPATGPGRPLLMINGLGSPLVAYEEGFVARFVERGFSVARFDNRDVGHSSRVAEDRTADDHDFHQPPYTLVDMARDATAVLDAVGWQQAHVFGQSMGGMIAQTLAINHPDRVRSMTSVMSSTGNPGYGRSTPEAHKALVDTPPRDMEGWLDHTVATGRIWATSDSWDPDKARDRARRLLEHGIDVDGTGRQFRAIIASGNRDDDLAALTVPTLVIHGSADTLIQPDGGRHTAAVIPGARLVEVDGMGHDLPASRWGLLAEAVAELAAEVEASTAQG